jgi:hypothetical protein
VRRHPLLSLQEESVVALLKLSQPRIAALLSSREALLAEARATVADAVQQEELLPLLQRVQSQYQITSAIFLLAFCSIISAPQLCAWLVASYPWAPSLASLHATVLARHEAAQASEAALEAAKRRRGRPRKHGQHLAPAGAAPAVAASAHASMASAPGALGSGGGISSSGGKGESG